MTRRSLLPLVVLVGAIALLTMHGISAHGHPLLPQPAHHAASAPADHTGATVPVHGEGDAHGQERDAPGHARAPGVAELCAWIVLGAIAFCLRRSASRAIHAERLPRHPRVIWTPDPPVPKVRLVSTSTST